jgi:hypothetical protein
MTNQAYQSASLEDAIRYQAQLCVTLDQTGLRRHHIIKATNHREATLTARARHCAETGAIFDEIACGDVTLRHKPSDIEYDPFMGSIHVANWRGQRA